MPWPDRPPLTLTLAVFFRAKSRDVGINWAKEPRMNREAKRENGGL